MKHNIYLFQAQYSISIKGNPAYWLPYSVGCIWSYAQQFETVTDNYNLAGLGFRREPPEQVVAKMDNPVIACFSCYVWNEKWSLATAKAVKDAYPDCKIIFGGPQTTINMPLQYPFIDSVIVSEGELSFVQLLDDYRLTGRIEPVYKSERVKDLDFPSPYTIKLFDQLIEDNPGAEWNMTFETNRGCPYSCTFCDWGGLTMSKIKVFSMERVKADLNWAIDKPVTYLICADANFGIFKDRDVEIAEHIVKVADQGMLGAVNLQYAKNSTDVVYDIGKKLGKLGRGITMSMQSMNPDTLKAIKRDNMRINQMTDIMKHSDRTGVITYTEVILGLPLETLESWKQGLADILEMGQHNAIDMWFAQTLKGAALGTEEDRQKYGIETQVVKDYYPLYHPDDWREIEEEIEIVVATNTMSRNDLIEAYMYAWMIIQLHAAGYTQVIARYCREIHGVDFRTFYDDIWNKLQSEEWVGPHFVKLKNVVDHYMKTGELLEDETLKGGAKGHGIHSMSYYFIYHNKDKFFELAIDTARKFAPRLDPNLLDLQKAKIFDPTYSYPLTIDAEFDLTTYTPVHSVVSVMPKVNENKLSDIKEKLDANERGENLQEKISLDMYYLRRQGLIKTDISSQPRIEDGYATQTDHWPNDNKKNYLLDNAV